MGKNAQKIDVLKAGFDPKKEMAGILPVYFQTIMTFEGVISGVKYNEFTQTKLNFAPYFMKPLYCQIADARTSARIEVQKISFSGIPTEGTWKITYGSNSTGDLNYDANAAAIQAALRNLPDFSQVEVVGNYTVGFTITFTGSSGNKAELVTSITDLDQTPTVSTILNGGEFVKVMQKYKSTSMNEKYSVNSDYGFNLGYNWKYEDHVGPALDWNNMPILSPQENLIIETEAIEPIDVLTASVRFVFTVALFTDVQPVSNSNVKFVGSSIFEKMITIAGSTGTTVEADEIITLDRAWNKVEIAQIGIELIDGTTLDAAKKTYVRLNFRPFKFNNFEFTPFGDFCVLAQRFLPLNYPLKMEGNQLRIHVKNDETGAVTFNIWFELAFFE